MKIDADALNSFWNPTPLTKAADEITSIRNHIYILSDEMPMTRDQYDQFQVIKSRLWDLQEKLRKPDFGKTL